MAGKDDKLQAYLGREQALVKHTLLQSYLEKLFMIVGMSAGTTGKIELCYVDCFAGPWGDDSAGMDTTSIAISLRTLDACRQALGSRGVSATIRALYIEENPVAFARLSAHLKTSTPSGVHAEPRCGDFVALRDEILTWVGPRAFALFFIDPKGWSPVGIETLRPLLERQRSEFLITFMYNDINRTMSMEQWKAPMKALLGESISLDGYAPEGREEAILRTYRKNLKACVPVRPKYPARSAYARILDPRKERPKYHLVYITSHPKGIVAFMAISEQADIVQKEVRAAKKDAAREERSGMGNLFPGSMIDPQAGHANAGDVDRFWMAYLQAGVRRIGESEFADILEETDWFPGDLQASLARLIKANRVRNLDAGAKRPKKPLHFEVRGGERLELVREAP